MRKSGLKIYVQTAKVKGRTYKQWVVDFGTHDGKRRRKVFRTQAAAEAEIESNKILAKRIGRQARRLSDGDILDAAKALDVLARAVTLETAARFYADHHPDGGKRTVAEAAEEFLQSRQEKGCRPVTVKDYADKLKMFCADIGGDRQLSHITVAVLESWLRKRGFGPESRLSYIRHLGAMFSWAVKHKYMVENPAQAIELPLSDKKTVQYLSVKDVEKLLRTAAAEYPELVPYVALGVFGGLRPSEIHGHLTGHGAIDWNSIDFEARLIRVAPEQTKTRDGRNVTMRDALLAWLAPYRKPNGPIPFSRVAFDSLVKLAGIRYSKDVLRHTAGTYLWAINRNEGETACQLGDTIKTVKRHYCNPTVDTKEAEKFWNVRPATDGKIILLAARAG